VEGAALMQTDHSPRGGRGAVMARQAGRRGGKAKAEVRAAELHHVRARVAHRGCGQARRPCK
jgi:hypothetical protein